MAAPPECRTPTCTRAEAKGSTKSADGSGEQDGNSRGLPKGRKKACTNWQPHGRRFCAEKASNFNKSQQLSTSGVQQVQYQSVRNNKFQQVSIRVGICFGTRGSEVQILSPP